jgi:hypothetical protein
MAQAEVVEKQQRAATNQALFREVNERVKDVNERFRVFTPLGDWVCECANDWCAERIEMTSEEYEHVRRAGARFFVAPGLEHVWPDVERIVERRSHYWIVEKIEHAGSMANESDPRNGGSSPSPT